MRAILVEPGLAPREIDVADTDAIRALIGADALDERPFTLTQPVLSIVFDDDFGRKGLRPTMYHPTYREKYALCGALVVVRRDDEGDLIGLTDADVARAKEVVSVHVSALRADAPHGEVARW